MRDLIQLDLFTWINHLFTQSSVCKFKDEIRSCFALLLAFAALGVVLNWVSFANVNLVP